MARTTTRSGTRNRTSNSGYTSSRRTTTSGTTRTTTGNRSSCAPGYTQTFTTFNSKIANYRVLASQATGSARFKRPSASTLKSFANWIDKGCNIQKVSNTQLTRWSRTTNSNFTPNSVTSARTTLCSKFGKSTIKAVCMDKSGNFIVATAPTWKGKPFCFPNT